MTANVYPDFPCILFHYITYKLSFKALHWLAKSIRTVNQYHPASRLHTDRRTSWPQARYNKRFTPAEILFYFSQIFPSKWTKHSVVNILTNEWRIIFEAENSSHVSRQMSPCDGPAAWKDATFTNIPNNLFSWLNTILREQCWLRSFKTIIFSTIDSVAYCGNRGRNMRCIL